MIQSILMAGDVASLSLGEMWEELEDRTDLSPQSIRRMTKSAMVTELLKVAVPEKVTVPVQVEEVETKPTPAFARNVGARSLRTAPDVTVCLCGCNQTTKGGRYRPGHDAKHESNKKGGPKKQPKLCKCGCKKFTKGGTFKPGHDARWYRENGGLHL
jgi:hypothetical protein